MRKSRTHLAGLCVAAAAFTLIPAAGAKEGRTFPLAQGSCGGTFTWSPQSPWVAHQNAANAPHGSHCRWLTPAAPDGTRFTALTYSFNQTSGGGKRVIRASGPNNIPPDAAFQSDYNKGQWVTLHINPEIQVALELYQAEAHNYGAQHWMNVGERTDGAHGNAPYGTAVDVRPPQISAMTVHCDRLVGSWCTVAPTVTFQTHDNDFGRGPTRLLANGVVVREWDQSVQSHGHLLDLGDGESVLDAYREGPGWAAQRYNGQGPRDLIDEEQDPGAPEEKAVSIDRNAPTLTEPKLELAQAGATNVRWSQSDGFGSGIRATSLYVHNGTEWVHVVDESDEGQIVSTVALGEDSWKPGKYPWKLETVDNVGHRRAVAGPGDIVVLAAGDESDPYADETDGGEFGDVGDLDDKIAALRPGPRLLTFTLAKPQRSKVVRRGAPLRVRVKATQKGRVVVQIRKVGGRKVLVQKTQKVTRARKVMEVRVPTRKLTPGKYVVTAKVRNTQKTFGKARGMKITVRARR